MTTSIINEVDDESCKFNKKILFNKSFFLYLDTQFDLITTTLLPFIENACENQTQTPLDEIQDRINVVVPYLVILGKSKKTNHIYIVFLSFDRYYW